MILITFCNHDIVCNFRWSYRKSLECAKLLVGAGADVNSRNAKDNTPLMVAAALGHYNILKFLIAQPNIEVNAQVCVVCNMHGSRNLVLVTLI